MQTYSVSSSDFDVSFVFLRPNLIWRAPSPLQQHAYSYPLNGTSTLRGGEPIKSVLQYRRRHHRCSHAAQSLTAGRGCAFTAYNLAMMPSYKGSAS